MFRPRLTEREVKFIAEVLKACAELVKKKGEAMESRRWKIQRLRENLLHSATKITVPELKRQRQQYAIAKRQNYYGQKVVAEVLARRFEALVEGGRLHSSMKVYMHLKD